MILPIFAYGQPVLKKIAAPVEPGFSDLPALIADMWETMYHADGVGLAAPQVGHSIRLFVIDTLQLDKEDGDEAEEKGFKKVFINAQKVEEAGDPWAYEEGCLSIPDIRENVRRPGDIRLRYFDENFHEITEEFGGMKARIIQHEYDHLEGVLFTDHISQLRRSMLKGRLSKISKGDISVDYPMKFPHKK